MFSTPRNVDTEDFIRRHPVLFEGHLRPLVDYESEEEDLGRVNLAKAFEDAAHPRIPKVHLPATRAMPYKKRKYSRSRSRGYSGMDAGVKAVAATLNRSIKAQDRQEKILRAAGALTGAEDMAEEGLKGSLLTSFENIDKRRALAIAEGRGAYKFGKAIQKFGQGKFGSSLKSTALSALGGFMGGGGMYTGRGAYDAMNSLVGGGVAPEVPQFHSAGDEGGAITVSRKEFLSDIYGPATGFDVQPFSINPGLETTFPWLSQIAQNYDEYEMKQLIFTYRSTTTDIGSTTNGQCGTIIMCTNYNAAAGPFEDKVVMMEYDGAMSSKTTESMLHGVECDPRKLSGAEGKYVRANPVISNQDLKTYDHGLFQLAIANSPAGFANQAIGELWVSYTVVLRKPKFFTARGLGISQDIYVSGGDESTTRFMGTQNSLLSGQQNNIGSMLTIGSNSIVITFPAAYAGYLEVRLASDGLTTIGGSVGINTGGTTTTVQDIYGSNLNGATDTPANFVSNTLNAIPTGGQLVYVCHINITPAIGNTDNTLTITTSNCTVAPVQSCLTIAEYNSGYSYRAQNLGAGATKSQAPILVNASGLVVVP